MSVLLGEMVVLQKTVNVPVLLLLPGFAVELDASISASYDSLWTTLKGLNGDVLSL